MACTVRAIMCCLGSSLLFACPPEPTTTPPLEDRTFLSQSVTEGGSPRALVDGTQLRLRFYEDPRVGASAGCNSMDATYEIVDGAFVLHGMGITEIGCDNALHAQDDWYFGFLGSEPGIEVDGDRLVLDGDGTVIEYLDQEVARPDLALVGRIWTVETIIRDEAATSVEWPAPATFAFADDGKVTVSTGCNSGTGTYALSGDTITFEDVAVTERGCADPATQMLESAVVDLVFGPQPVDYEITVDRLSLRGADVGLDLRGSDG